LDWSKWGEVAGIKIQTKAIPKKHRYHFVLKSGSSERLLQYSGNEAETCAFNPGTENPELYQLLELNNIKSEVAFTLFY
jgi:hypothetical protein